MHYIIGLGLIAVLVGFAFGENAARTVVGAALAGGAVLVLTFVGTMLYVVHRDNAKYHAWQERTASCVKLANAMPLTGDCR